MPDEATRAWEQRGRWWARLRRRPRSLRARLLLWFTGLIALAVVLVGVALSARTVQLLQRQYEATYRSAAQAVVAIIDDHLQGAIQGNHLSLVRGDLRALVSSLGQGYRLRVRLYDLHGVLLADSRDAVALLGKSLATDNFAPLAYPAAVVPPGKTQPVPVARIAVSDPLNDRAYQERQFLGAVAWITLGALLLTLVVGGILSDRLTAPLRVLTRATARMDAGALGLRVPEGQRDEAGELARQFNRMAERLEESFRLLSAERDRLALDRDGLRQFVADVSHELRTPLTALYTFNDLLQGGAGEDPATRREFLAESAGQIERLNWLTRNLLDLSRLEAGITRIEPRPADLGETLRRAVASNSPAAGTKGVAILLDAPPLVVTHDAPRLEQALGNIIGNAVKFSPPGGTVDVRIYVCGARVVVEARDEGPGIPPDEAPRVFERFYRGRDANRGGEGSGLGLAIAKAIVDAHSGAIEIQSGLDRGTAIVVGLPISDSTPDGAHS